MPKEKEKIEEDFNIKDKISDISDYLTKKTDEEKKIAQKKRAEKITDEPIKTEGEDEEEIQEPTPPEKEPGKKIKDILAIAKKLGSRKLTKEQKKEFDEDFDTWTDLAYTILDIEEKGEAFLEKIRFQGIPDKIALPLFVLCVVITIVIARKKALGEDLIERKKESKARKKPLGKDEYYKDEDGVML